MRALTNHPGRMDAVLLASLMLAFALRLANLLQLPVFYDEAVYLNLARETYKSLDATTAFAAASTLQIWLVALVYGLSPSALWVGRFVSAMFGALTAAACYRIAGELYREPWAARLAALLYAVVPYAVFHDRLAQNDGILSFFLALVVYFSLVVARPAGRRALIRNGMWLVLVYGLALLAKRSAVLFLVAPPLAVVLFGEKKAWLRVAAVVAGMALVTIPVALITVDTGDQLTAHLASFDWPVWSAQLVENVTELGEWFWRYFLPPAVLLLGLALVNLVLFRRRQEMFLFLLAAVPVLFFTPVSETWYPRYLMPSVFPLVILLAGQVKVAARLWKQHSPLVAVLLVGVIALPMFWFDIALARDPLIAHLPQEDRWQYIEGMPAGYGLPEAADFLRQLADRQGPINVWRNNRSVPPRYGLWHYLPTHPNIDFDTFRTDRKSWAEIERQFDESAREKPVYLVLNIPYEKGVPNLDELDRLMPVKLFPKPGTAGFVIGVYRWLTPLEYMLLSANLKPGATIGLAPGLANIPMLTAVERLNLVAFTKEPLTLVSRDELDYLAADSASLRRAGLLDEEGLLELPPGWTVESGAPSCEPCLFRLWDEGEVQVVAELGTDIVLTGVQLPQAPWPTGVPLPLTLYWQTGRAETDPDMAVFLHAVSGPGQMAAQNDKTWLDGAFPAQIHHPDDILSQQFQLDFAGFEGQVCLYTGMYHRSTGERLAARQRGQLLPDNAIPLGCGSVVADAP
ncbi:MAG: phospholipid carrier-dependent glycosyltransferase [Caldilineae bacterium]|nr:MAG: phospholipid carrier-dependent glycosyltransferase [Caldilineae bacterium]